MWIDGLLFKLFNFGVRGKTWRLLRNWYGKMSYCVSLEGFLSDRFSIKQGVRQGGVLSPWLFMCFNNDVTETMLKLDVVRNLIRRCQLAMSLSLMI